MAQTTAAALKVLIESLGLGLAAYGDRPSQGTPRPYVTILEEIALVPDPMEDGGPSTAVETAQVDLWQDWRDLTPGPTEGNLKENYTLAPALKRGIHGQRLQLIGTSVVYMVLVRHSVRSVEEDGNAVHHAVTVEIHRQL
jgi:hypothetical protein